MKMTPQERRDRFVASIMKKNKVSIVSVANCLDKQEADIEDMLRIFDAEGDHDEKAIRMRLVLLHLMSRDHAEENLEYYRELKKVGVEFFASDLDEYKTLIISALLSNTQFYVMACNWCGLVRYHAENFIASKSLSKQPEADKALFGNRKKLRIPSRAIYGSPSKKRLEFKFATGTGFQSLLTDDNKLKLNHDGIEGVLDITANGAREIQLVFQFKEPQDTIPFWLEFAFRISDGKESEIPPIPIGVDERLWFKNKEDKITQIRSKIMSGIDYTKGIEGDYTITVVPPDNVFESTGRTVSFIRIPRRMEKIAADGAADAGFTEFESIPITHDENSGTLRFMENNQKETYLEFIFDRFHSIIPFELEICFTTTSEQKEHTIVIPADVKHSKKDREKNQTKIFSDIVFGVDYSKGIEAGCRITPKILNI